MFPRVILQWKEPRVAGVAGRREAKRSLMRMMSASLLGALPVIWMTHRMAPEVTGRVALALALVILFLFFVFWIYRVFPSRVTVTEMGISQSVTTEDEQNWKFKAMRQCSIVTRRVGGQSVRMLVIETRKGECSSVAIADCISTAELEAVLTRCGVQVAQSAEQPDLG